MDQIKAAAINKVGQHQQSCTIPQLTAKSEVKYLAASTLDWKISCVASLIIKDME